MYKGYYFLSKRNNAKAIKNYSIMQTTENTIIKRHNLQSAYFEEYSEIEKKLESKLGGFLFFRETSFNGLQFVRCDYSLSEKELLIIDVENEVLEMHFRLNGLSHINTSKKSLEVKRGSNFLTYDNDNKQEVWMHPTEKGAFFEIRIGTSHFEKLIDGFSNTDSKDFFGNYPLITTPEMFAIINQIENSNYSGNMKALFYEAKMTELFLLQIQQVQQRPTKNIFSYKEADKNKIYDVKYLIEKDFNDCITISKLAQLTGINKRKLMQGFKELFGTTIYQYVLDLKMQESRRLLLDENKYVNEVASLIGYKNPQHFIVAFKKKFGFSPGKLKE